MPPPLFDVVVVGAGLSGLMACDILSRHDKELTICLVEARDRIGGRVETHEDGFDLGAGWIGPTHKELLGLIHRYPSLHLVDQYYPTTTTTATQRLTECVGFPQLPLQAKDQEMVQEYMSLIERINLEIDLEAPWRHPMAEKFDTMSAKDHIEASIPSNEARQEIMLFCQTVLACRVDKISFLFLLFYIKSGGGMAALGDGEDSAQKWKLETGMGGLTSLMERDILKNKVTIRKGCCVESVIDTGGTIELQIRGGTKVRCDRVIFALSPQLVAKMNFFPELEKERVDLGHAICPGKAIKVHIAFDNPFWLSPSLSNVTDSSATVAFTNGPVHNFFHSKMGDSPALVGLITGAAAEECELVPDLKSRVVQQIQTMYRVQEEPRGYVEKRWGLEEHSGGCFAGICPPDGSLFRLGHLLRTPVGRFHWASTETATEFYGYMEGALLAGTRAANEVLLCGKRKTKALPLLSHESTQNTPNVEVPTTDRRQ
jgi:monoamine oxidase